MTWFSTGRGEVKAMQREREVQKGSKTQTGFPKLNIAIPSSGQSDPYFHNLTGPFNTRERKEDPILYHNPTVVGHLEL
jgi:hypothetical protein